MIYFRVTGRQTDYSLSIVPQSLNCPLRRKPLAHPPPQSYNAASSNEKRFPSGIGESSPKTGREAFLTT